MGEDVGFSAGVNRHALVRGQTVAARLPEASPGPAIGIGTASDLVPERYRNTLYRLLHGNPSALPGPVLLAHLLGELLEVEVSHVPNRHHS